MSKKKNNVLPAIRINSELAGKIKEALELLNSSESGLTITLVQFREWALKHFSEEVLVNGLELKFKPKL